MPDSADTTTFINSPDALVQRIRFGIKPPAPNAIIDLLQQDDRLTKLKAALQITGKSSDLPLTGITTANFDILIAPLDTVLEPALNPFLVTDNLAAARSLYVDCVELRRRVETLQQDIFNLEQEKLERESETALQTDLRNQQTENINRLTALIGKKTDEIGRQQKVLNDVIALNAEYGPTVVTNKKSDRALSQLKRQIWPLSHTVTETPDATTKPELRYHHHGKIVANAAQLADDPSTAILDVYNLTRLDAIRSAAIEATGFPTDIARNQNTLSNLESQKTDLEASLSKARSDLRITESRWITQKKLWDRKQAQANSATGLGLFRRLEYTLQLYSEVAGQLRKAVHAVEFGQVVVFGMKIDGFDPASTTLRNRYLVSSSFAVTPVTGSFKNAAADDGFWAPIDQLGLMLLQAEARQRTAVQKQHVWQEVIELSGQFDASGKITLTKDLTRMPISDSADPLSPPKFRVVGLRCINSGPVVELGCEMKSAEPFPGAAMVDDPIYKIINARRLHFRYKALARAEPAMPAEQVMNPPQYINRHANGTLTVNLTKKDPADASYKVKIEMMLAR